MDKTRAESTRELTVLAFSWLFMRRKCRVLCDEIGIGGLANRLTPSGMSQWRADAAGITQIGRQFRIDVVEVKGSRADARREDMTAGKWELLPQGKRLNGWLLVSAECRPEDYHGLPLAWGVLQASADATTLRIIRKPVASGLIPYGEILLDPADAAQDIFHSAYRTLTSRIPFLGRAVPEAVAKLHEVDAAEPADFLGFDAPDPLPAQIPGGPGDVKQLDLDSARTYPISWTIRLPTTFDPKNEGVLPIRGLDGKVVGYGVLKLMGNGAYSLDGSIDYSSEERLLIETQQARLGNAIDERGVAIEWKAPDGQS